MSSLRGVVFDCDGLLIDSGDCWEAAYAEALRRRGRELSDADRRALNGASVRIAADLLKTDVAELGELLADSFASRPLTLRPGVREALDDLGGIPLAVATNGPARLARTALERLGIASRFTAIVSAETLRDKPAPDVYLAACAALDVDPAEAIAFEDSLMGARAARDAGLRVVFIPSVAGETFPDSYLEASRVDDRGVRDALATIGAAR